MGQFYHFYVKEVLKRFLICALIVLFCCEYLIYHVVIYQCSWPILERKDSFENGKFVDKSQSVRAVLLSDPHLLGSQHGHWFDKLRREWQMKQSFQTAINYFQPEIVFILGDIFDEGMICSNKVSRASLMENTSEMVMSCLMCQVNNQCFMCQDLFDNSKHVL